ncbi:ATP-binding cassette domain-containing protein [Candidatus Babeliales bacterium]|nr:ATP-binding cassette domain-containing protein [Candidatus Babeliales bacterium]
MIELINVEKSFGDTKVTKGVTLKIPDNQITCIVGRSGEGKSVLLKQIIGLLRPTAGKILIDGEDTAQFTEQQLDANFDKFGYVFQFAALLDSLTVFENVGIKLIEQGMPKNKVRPIVEEKLALVHLDLDTLDKYPAELSGGMRKRVGLARTLISQPKYMLYDEPTTGLDPITSRVIHELMVDIQQANNSTSIVISHDVEIFKFVDKVALLHDGKIQFFGDAKTIWDTDNPYVYQFIRGLSEGPIQNEITHTTTRV